MTEKELFLKFCKIQGILPILKKWFYEREPMIWVCQDSKYYQVKCDFNEYFKQKNRNHDLADLYYRVFCDITPGRCVNNETYKACFRRWRYFVKNNVILKSLKPGDVVKYDWWNAGDNTCTGVVRDIMNDYGNVNVSETMESDRKRTIAMHHIISVNDEKPVFDYCIKYKNKVYGLD